MKRKLDMDKIARALGAERVGAVKSGSGAFAASQLAAEVKARFKTPATGGRATDPSWTDRRLVPVGPATLSRLERLADSLEAEGVRVAPLQLAALLLERALDGTSVEAAAREVRQSRGS